MKVQTKGTAERALTRCRSSKHPAERNRSQLSNNTVQAQGTARTAEGQLGTAEVKLIFEVITAQRKVAAEKSEFLLSYKRTLYI